VINILAIDTTLNACSASILKDGVIVSENSEIRSRGHVERLLSMIDETCIEAQMDISDFNYVALSIGPGTFAGVRIGLSAAKGLCLGLNIPLIPVTTLATIAYQYSEENKDFNGHFAVAIEARRGEVYLENFSVFDGNCKSLTDPQAVLFDHVNDKLADDIKVIIGSGATLLQERLSQKNIQFLENYNQPTASIIALLAATNMEGAKYADDVSPLYLRAPDAILPKKLEMNIIDE
jgi:tRNA threonylcarbamoyladenosine biosynthesis protein TsaB